MPHWMASVVESFFYPYSYLMPDLGILVNVTLSNYSHSNGEWEGRTTDQGMDGIESMDPFEFGGIDDRGQGCIGL
jgi:hypothetical protein